MEGLIYILMILLCACLLYVESKYNGAGINMGLILVVVILFSLSGMYASYHFYYKHGNFSSWGLWSDREMMERITLINAVFIGAFTFFYLIGNRIYSNNIKTEHVAIKSHILYNHNNPILWAGIYLLSLGVAFYLKFTGKLYLWTYWLIVVDLAYMALLASLFIRIKHTVSLILVMGGFASFMMFVYYPILAAGVEEQYTVNKGGVALLVVFSCVYLHIVKYDGKLITPFRLIIGLLVLPAFIGAANYVEASVTGSTMGFLEFAVYLIQGYEMRMYENQYLIITWIEDGQETYRYGGTYVNAMIDIIYPWSEGTQSPREWITELTNYGKKHHSGRNFSFVAEGFLNFGHAGILVAAFLAASILILLRIPLDINSPLSPVFYSVTCGVPYYIYRSDFAGVIKKLEFYIGGIIIIWFLYIFTTFLLQGARRNQSQAI